LGHTLIHAENGAQAIKMVKSESPDLILLDVQMPVMDGVQVLSYLKKDPSLADIPVVVVTTIGRSQDREILVKGGASALLPKPINGNDLIRVVQELLPEDSAA
jgi:CheY-like chemotaxis protein